MKDGKIFFWPYASAFFSANVPIFALVLCSSLSHFYGDTLGRVLVPKVIFQVATGIAYDIHMALRKFTSDGSPLMRKR